MKSDEGSWREGVGVCLVHGWILGYIPLLSKYITVLSKEDKIRFTFPKTPQLPRTVLLVSVIPKAASALIMSTTPP